MPAGAGNSMPIVAELRRRFAGVLSIELAEGGLTEPVRFVLDGREGRVVFALRRPLAEAESVVLFVPDEHEDAVQLLVTPEEIIDWRGSEACDRWAVHHGKADGSRWFACAVAGSRFGRAVYDADEIDLRNPLHAAEPRLCKMAASDRAALERLAERRAGGPLPGALCVGVDHLGMVIKGPLGLLRIDFPGAAGAALEAEAFIGALLAGG